MTRMREVLELGQEMKERLVALSTYGMDLHTGNVSGTDAAGHLSV